VDLNILHESRRKIINNLIWLKAVVPGGPLLAESGPSRLLTDRWQSSQTDDYSPLIASIGQTGSGGSTWSPAHGHDLIRPSFQHRSVTPDGRVTRLKVCVRSRCNIKNIQFIQLLTNHRYTSYTSYTSYTAFLRVPYPRTPYASIPPANVTRISCSVPGPLRFSLRHGVGNPPDFVSGQVPSLVNR
jgi:hypothetical protein